MSKKENPIPVIDSESPPLRGKDYLSLFCQHIGHYPQIRPSHISLYLAIYHRWKETGRKRFVIITRSDLMESARIKSISTYHKCIKDLSNLRFITYKPSYDYYTGSQIELL